MPKFIGKCLLYLIALVAVVMVTTATLKWTFDTMLSRIGVEGNWGPTLVLVVLAIIVALTAWSKKKSCPKKIDNTAQEDAAQVTEETPKAGKGKTDKKKDDDKLHSMETLNAAAWKVLWISIPLLLWAVVLFFCRTEIATAYKVAKTSYTEYKQKERLTSGQWTLSWEVEKNDLVPEMTRGKFEAFVTINNEERLEFWHYYDDHGRRRIAEFKGCRTGGRNYHEYKGTWSQGKPGDTDYLTGRWEFTRVNRTMFKGKGWDYKGEPYQQELAFR